MSIGETLARARRDAGLSIGEISSRTRVELSLIDDIEHDDYSACSGDRRARDNIAAIARALALDPQSLIEAFDAERRPTEPTEWIYASEPSEPRMAEAFQAFAPDGEPMPVAADEDTQPITIGQPSDPITAGEPVLPITVGEPFYPSMPADAATWAEGSRPVRLAYSNSHPFMWIALGGVLVAVAGLGAILIIVGASGQAARHAFAAGRHHTGDRGAARPPRTPQPSPRSSASSSARTPPASPLNGRPVQALVPASIAAFGPGGTGQGDSPQLAGQALKGKTAAPWHSDWYTTSHFGNLQSGTGLLLDMGRTVTIISARIALGNRAGADLTLRVGNSPILASLSPVAHADGIGGVVQLKTAQARGRYVLVWFTRLPPDQAGTFQVSVSDIKVRGHP